MHLKSQTVLRVHIFISIKLKEMSPAAYRAHSQAIYYLILSNLGSHLIFYLGVLVVKHFKYNI